MTPPLIFDDLDPPILKTGEVIVVTSEDATYWIEACENIDESPEDYPGLSKQSACNWAIYGFTVQDWLSFLSSLAEIEAYVNKLKEHKRFYEKQLLDRYDARKSMDR